MISVHVGTRFTVEGEVGERTKLSVLVDGEWPEEHGTVIEGKDEAFAREGVSRSLTVWTMKLLVLGCLV